MIFGLKIVQISSEHYTTTVFPNVYSFFRNISHFRRTSILSLCPLQAQKVAKYTATWTWPICGGIRKISFLPEWRLCQSYVNSTRPHWPIFGATSMLGCSISQLVIFEKISAAHEKYAAGFPFSSSCVPRKGLKILTRSGIPWLALSCSHSGILTYLAPAWNGILLMDFSGNVILLLLPVLGTIQNMSWLIKSHLAHARCVKFIKVHRWGIQLFAHLITKEINMFTWSFRMKLILMFCTLLVFMLHGGVCSSSWVCAGVCEGVSIESCNETCRIDIRSIDD